MRGSYLVNTLAPNYNSDGQRPAVNTPDTISRVIFTAIDKQAADSLAITWNHKILGA